MSREIKPREMRHNGLPASEQKLGLSTVFYKRRMKQQEERQAQQQREHHDRQQDGNKENEGINTRGSGNKYNQQTDYTAMQPKQAIPIEEYYSQNTQESLKQLGRFVQQVAFDQRQAAWAQGQVDRAQAFDQQLADMQTAHNPSEISNIVLQERATNPGGEAERKAFGDIANTTERGQINPSSIETDNNSVNPNKKRKREISEDSQQQQILNDLRRNMTDLPEIDKDEIKEQVKKRFKQEQLEDRERAKQELANRLRYQGVMPPNSDAAQSDKKSAADTDPKLDNQLSQEQAALNAAMTRLGQIDDASSSEAQNLRNTIQDLQSAIQAAKAKANDASKSHT